MPATLSWNRALVVAGPVADVEAFETAAGAGHPKAARGATDSIRQAFKDWREKPRFSLRTLLRLVDRIHRRELRAGLPRDKNPLLASR